MASDQPRKDQQHYFADYNAAAIAALHDQSPSNLSLTPPSASDQTLFTPPSLLQDVIDLSEDDQYYLQENLNTPLSSMNPLLNYGDDESRSLLWTGAAPTRMPNRDETVNNGNVYSSFDSQNLFHQASQPLQPPHHQLPALRAPLSQLYANNDHPDPSWHFSACSQVQNSGTDAFANEWETWVATTRKQNDHLTVNPNQVYGLFQNQELYESQFQPPQPELLLANSDEEIQPPSSQSEPYCTQATTHTSVVPPIPYDDKDEYDQELIWQQTPNPTSNEPSVLQKPQVYANNGEDDHSEKNFDGAIGRERLIQSSSKEMQDLGFSTKWTNIRSTKKGDRKELEYHAYLNDPQGSLFETDKFEERRKEVLEQMKGKEHLYQTNTGRAKNVCRECHYAKTRCSLDDPCQRCVKKGFKCWYPEAPKRRGRGRNNTRDSRDRSTSPDFEETPIRRRGPYKKRQKLAESEAS